MNFFKAMNERKMRHILWVENSSSLIPLFNLALYLIKKKAHTAKPLQEKTDASLNHVWYLFC